MNTFGQATQGSLFGSTQQTPGFGTAQQGTAFGGGGTQAGSWFSGGQQQQQQQQQPGSFGGAQTSSIFASSQPQQQQQSTGFGTTQAGTGFGSTQTGTGSFFNAPQQQQQQQQATGFASAQPTSTFFSSPQQQPQQSTGLFGGTTQPSTGSSWFSSAPQQTSTFSSFGGGTGGLFGAQKPTSFSFPSSFGQPIGAGQQPLSLQQQQQQQQQQQSSIDEQAAFHQSIFGCAKFGDERDSILANLNFVQACWGAGKGFFNQANVPVTYNDKNVLYRFKAVVYSFMYTESNEDGNVVIHIKKPQSKVCDEETQLISTLQSMMQKPNIFFKISGTKAISEDMTLLVLTADDRVSLRRVLATDLASALLQPQFKPQLDNLGIVSVCPKVKPSPEQLKAYLENPPAGLDPRVWKKAQEDNPDPENMIPIPLLGPDALKNRLEAQQNENQQHLNRLKLISDEIGNLHNRHANMSAELQQLRRQHTITTHRVISAIVRLQILQKHGFPMQPEEDELRKQVQELEKQLNSPTHFRGRLNELMSHARVHKTTLENRGLVKYSVDGSTLDQVKDFLNLQQGSITHLVDTVKSCLEYLQRMNEDFEKLGI